MPRWYQDAAWNAMRALCGPALLRKYGVEADFIDAEPSRPYLLMANHAHEADAWVLGALLSRTVRYMANLEGSGLLKTAMAELAGAYGKRKGVPDIAALRRTLELARSGETMGIFPEGDRSWDGRFQGIRPGTGKLIKALGLPVLMARQEGSYLSRPRWADSPRRGSWRIRFRILDEGQVRELPCGEIESAVSRWIGVDDIEARHGSYECPKPAEGAERILWLCPRCGSLHSIHTQGELVRCTACDTSWTMDADQRMTQLFLFRNVEPRIRGVRDWLELQDDALRLRAAGVGRRGTMFPPDRAELWRDGDGSWHSLGSGSIWLEAGRVGLRLDRGGPAQHIPLSGMRGFVDHFNRIAEFSSTEGRFRLRFAHPGSYKWIRGLAILGSGEKEAS